MTENEAVEELKESLELPFGSNISDEASRMAMKALEEIQQYRAIGTVEEIKEILQIISEGQNDVDESGISTGLLHTLLEYAEYKKIGTVEECREARERQRGKKQSAEKTYKDRNPIGAIMEIYNKNYPKMSTQEAIAEHVVKCLESDAP